MTTAPLLFQPHGIKHVSPSQLDAFIRCPQCWYYQYVERLPRKASGNLIVGTAAHNALAHYFRYKWKMQKQMEEAELLGSFSNDFDKRARKETDIDWGTDTKKEPLDEGKTKDRGIIALRAVAKDLLPHINPVKVEASVRRDIPGTDIVLLGYIDVLEAGAIRDYKFTGRMKTEDDAHQSRQLSAYAWMVGKPLAEDKSEFEVSLEVATFAGRTERRASTRSQARLSFYEHRVLARVVAAMHQCLESGNFPCLTEGWQCSKKFCDFWGECMGKVRGGAK